MSSYIKHEFSLKRKDSFHSFSLNISNNDYPETKRLLVIEGDGSILTVNDITHEDDNNYHFPKEFKEETWLYFTDDSLKRLTDFVSNEKEMIEISSSNSTLNDGVSIRFWKSAKTAQNDKYFFRFHLVTRKNNKDIKRIRVQINSKNEALKLICHFSPDFAKIEDNDKKADQLDSYYKLLESF